MEESRDGYKDVNGGLSQFRTGGGHRGAGDDSDSICWERPVGCGSSGLEGQDLEMIYFYGI